MEDETRIVELKGIAQFKLDPSGKLLGLEHFEMYTRFMTREKMQRIAEGCIDRTKLVDFLLNLDENWIDTSDLVAALNGGQFSIGRKCPVLVNLSDGEALPGEL